MHAGTTSAALLNPGRPRMGKAPAPAPRDLFQACLQGRMVRHLEAAREEDGGPGPAGAARPGRRPWDSRAARPGGTTSGSVLWEVPEGGVIPPEALPRLAERLTQAGVPPEQVRAWLAEPRFQERGVTAREMGAFLRGVRGTGTPGPALAENDAGALPPALAELLALAAHSPGERLPIPPTRQPEAAARLLAAGLPAGKVEGLLSHPEVQEAGLTPERLLSWWQKDLAGPAREAEAPGPVTSPAWRELWERLRLPAEALPEVRLALQQLGVPPEALSRLEEDLSRGFPLKEVWQLLQEAHRRTDSPLHSLAEELASTDPQDPDLWGRLLRQAGVPEETVTSLWGGVSPASLRDLRARLLKLAPPPAPPAAQETPKPLYLPVSLRLGPPQGQAREEWHPPGEESPGRLPGPGSGPPSPVAGEQEEAYAALAREFPFPAATPAAAAPGPAPASVLTPALRQAVWSQIETAVLAHLRPGGSQVSLSLNPPELGRVELTLHLKGEHLMVQALMSRPEVAQLAQAQVAQLIQALARQGVILSQFQVQVPGPPVAAVAVASGGSRTGPRNPEGGAPGTPSRFRTRGVDFFA